MFKQGLYLSGQRSWAVNSMVYTFVGSNPTNPKKLTKTMFFIYILLLILPIVITVAFYTLAERKIIAAIQRRTGPNIVGFWGLLQPFADGLKAIIKEQIKPLRAVFYLFLFAPMLTFFLSLLALNFICFQIDRSYFDEYLNFFFFF